LIKGRIDYRLPIGAGHVVAFYAVEAQLAADGQSSSFSCPSRSAHRSSDCDGGWRDRSIRRWPLYQARRPSLTQVIVVVMQNRIRATIAMRPVAPIRDSPCLAEDHYWVAERV
jgi:hypothetical protein